MVVEEGVYIISIHCSQGLFANSAAELFKVSIDAHH